MGFYLRKSVRVGPLRFNFSKSGIGVSAGIPGLRIGTGPRGHYVHAGAHGIYYRASLGGGASRHPSAGSTTPRSFDRPAPASGAPLSDPTLGPEVAITSGSVLAMADTTSDELLQELRAKRAKLRMWPFAAVAGGLAFVASVQATETWLPATVAVIAVVAVIVTQQWDQLRKSTVIMYDLEGPASDAYSALRDAMGSIVSARRMWHVQSQAAVLDAKYHAGAGATIRRTSVGVRTALPPFVKSNIDVPTLNAGRETLYFFPDRLLVYDGGSVGAVGYDALRLTRGTTRFIEDGPVPSDSQVVGRTWRYVNKNGTPDRRFNNNRELPIAQYETIHFQSGTGLNELFQVSRVGAAQPLESWLRSRPRLGTGSSALDPLARLRAATSAVRRER